MPPADPACFGEIPPELQRRRIRVPLTPPTKSIGYGQGVPAVRRGAAITGKLDAGLSLQRIWQDLVEEYGLRTSGAESAQKGDELTWTYTSCINQRYDG
jgi:hypothetical protein